jgi:SnoaL-like domain
MSDVQKVIDDYFAMWNEDDEDRRKIVIEKCFVEDGRYTDPLADVVGHDGIGSMVGALRESHAGYSLRLSSAIDQHHDRLRFEWEILDADGGTYLSGVDLAVLADDGRLASITGFFGSVPDRLAA